MSIDEMISDLKDIKDAMNQLVMRRKELETQILAVVPYNPLGQKTIETAQYKIKVTAGINYRVSQEVAAQYSDCFSEDMHPLRAVVKYELDAKKYKQLLMYPELMEIANQFVIETPKSIAIEVL